MSKNLKLFIKITITSAILFIFPIIYVMPRVIMLGAEYKLTNTEVVTNEGKAPLNHISHTHRLPTAKDKIIVRLNTDTFYSSGWFQLEDEPFVLQVPKTDGRYYSLQFNDSWTNAFAYVGKRSTGNEAANYVIVGPNWKGNLPSDLVKIVAPTNLIWVIGRTMYYGNKDIENVIKIQNEIIFTPLSKFIK
ncbi:MAG: DUF1254 domain-containing protein [Bacteroidota bacterium]|nr:DUF1254 domain-containing protein [Bacteroidota bacterium]